MNANMQRLLTNAHTVRRLQLLSPDCGVDWQRNINALEELIVLQFAAECGGYASLTQIATLLWGEDTGDTRYEAMAVVTRLGWVSLRDLWGPEMDEDDYALLRLDNPGLADALSQAEFNRFFAGYQPATNGAHANGHTNGHHAEQPELVPA